MENENLNKVMTDLELDVFKQILSFNEKMTSELTKKYIWKESQNENDSDKFCKTVMKTIAEAVELGREYERVCGNTNFKFTDSCKNF